MTHSWARITIDNGWFFSRNSSKETQSYKNISASYVELVWASQLQIQLVFSKSCLILSHSTIVFSQFPNIRNGPYLWIFHVIIVQEQSEFNYFHTSWLPIFNWSNLHISRRPLHDQDRTWQCGQCHLDPVFHWASLLAPGHHGKGDT